MTIGERVSCEGQTAYSFVALRQLRVSWAGFFLYSSTDVHVETLYEATVATMPPLSRSSTSRSLLGVFPIPQEFR